MQVSTIKPIPHSHHLSFLSSQQEHSLVESNYSDQYEKRKTSNIGQKWPEDANNVFKKRGLDAKS